MKIAIASCASCNEVPAQSVWEDLGKEGADLLLLAGDQIYYNKLGHDEGGSVHNFQQRLAAEYQKQWAEPHFKALLESGLPWSAVWDDHDYAWNNAGGALDPARKAVTTQLFLTYQKGTIKPLRNTVHHDFFQGGVHFILLDCRSWRDQPSLQATPLGLAQEQWLWEKLAEPAQAIVVVCGSPLSFGNYSLEHYPAFTNRLLEFLSAKDLRIFFVGGDVHDNTYQVEDRVIELVSSGVARKYLFANKRNYAILSLDLPAKRAVYEMVSKKKRLSTAFDLASWQEL